MVKFRPGFLPRLFLTKKNTTMETITGMPRIGDKAPDFEAVTTTGKLKFYRIYESGYFECGRKYFCWW